MIPFDKALKLLLTGQSKRFVHLCTDFMLQCPVHSLNLIKLDAQSNVQEQSDTAAWYGRPAESWGEGERLLACGASAVADLRAAVQAELGFSCSAGQTLRNPSIITISVLSISCTVICCCKVQS